MTRFSTFIIGGPGVGEGLTTWPARVNDGPILSTPEQCSDAHGPIQGSLRLGSSEQHPCDSQASRCKVLTYQSRSFHSGSRSLVSLLAMMNGQQRRGGGEIATATAAVPVHKCFVACIISRRRGGIRWDTRAAMCDAGGCGQRCGCWPRFRAGRGAVLWAVGRGRERSTAG